MTLHEWLKHQGMTQTEFSVRLGTLEQNIHNWAHGKRFPLPIWLHRIAEATEGKVMPNDFLVTWLKLREIHERWEGKHGADRIRRQKAGCVTDGRRSWSSRTR
jgi:transcriptional regulator with XRE-family HTH domain